MPSASGPWWCPVYYLWRRLHTLLFVWSQVSPCLGCVEEVSVVGDEYRRIVQLASELLEEELNMTQVIEITQVYSAARQVR